jgi:DNA-binding MarR family transcriptional regulator
MPTARTPSKPVVAGARVRSPNHSSSPQRLQDDDDWKRLLAAIFAFSSLLRRPEPPHQQPSSRLALGRVMQAHGLGTRHASALLLVALHGPMTVTQLAQHHHVQVKTASLLAVELEQAGLLQRREDPADRRRTIITIANGMERAVDRGLNNRAAPLQRALDRLTPAQREGLITGLEVLTEELSRDRRQDARPAPKRKARQAERDR